MTTQDIINNIKDLAKDYEVSLKDLALKIGVTEQGLHGMFKNKSIKLDTLEAIATALDVEMIDLFDDGREDEYYKVVSELKNLKKHIRKMAVKGKGVIDIEFNSLSKSIYLDFAELKEKVNPSYYEESDNLFKEKEDEE